MTAQPPNPRPPRFCHLRCCRPVVWWLYVDDDAVTIGWAPGQRPR
jgi:hypothetical protein